MSQHDFSIANQTASSARSDINDALQALASNNSGVDAPTTTYANMLWYETDTNRLKMRNEGDTAWLDLGYIDQTDGLEILDNTKVVTTSGTQTGILGDQSTGTWQAGTGTTQSLVSPANVKAAIDAARPPVTAGGVGSYAMVRPALSTSAQRFTFGTTYAGSGLYPAGPSAYAGNVGSGSSWNSSGYGMANGYYLSAALSGTWMSMGETHQTYDNPITVAVRIS